MQDDNLKWSPAYPLFGAKHHLDVRGKPGVYKVLLSAQAGKPRPHGLHPLRSPRLYLTHPVVRFGQNVTDPAHSQPTHAHPLPVAV